MSNSEKHGMFDEISLRESINVNTNTLTYQGFEDFGNDVEYNKTDKKCNHGLVFAFQSLCGNFIQPIGVFAAHGNVKGIFLIRILHFIVLSLY